MQLKFDLNSSALQNFLQEWNVQHRSKCTKKPIKSWRNGVKSAISFLLFCQSHALCYRRLFIVFFYLFYHWLGPGCFWIVLLLLYFKIYSFTVILIALNFFCLIPSATQWFTDVIWIDFFRCLGIEFGSSHLWNWSTNFQYYQRCRKANYSTRLVSVS